MLWKLDEARPEDRSAGGAHHADRSPESCRVDRLRDRLLAQELARKAMPGASLYSDAGKTALRDAYFEFGDDVASLRIE